MKNVLNGMSVIARAKDAVYLRIPKELQVPCNGCDCPYCKAHLNEVPSWDTLGVPTANKRLNTAWTLHMPNPAEFQRIYDSKWYQDRQGMRTRAEGLTKLEADRQI